MVKHLNSRWLVALIFVGIMVGVLSGGLMGGVVGYYAAQGHASTTAVSTSAQASAQSSTLASLLLTENSAITDAVKKAEPAVVTVVNTTQTRSGRAGVASALAEGSGVIIDAEGHIITNAHVVQNAQQIDVIYNDGTHVRAQLVGADTTADIAVLQVSGAVPAFLSLGDSNALQLGETVIAIGSPLGDYRGSVTVGVVSGLNRSVQGSGQDGLVQTDAAINNGDSGGPLLNLTGEVIGINTLAVRDASNGDIAEGLGFAIPSNTVSKVAQQIITQGA